MKTSNELAAALGLTEGDIAPWGPHLAKLKWETVERLRAQKPKGKLVLVSAMTATRYGEGKTTTTIGLAQGLVKKGVKAVAAVREPSLGPVFGTKGGGTGGGRCMVEPSSAINLHCTGDLHAITSANNLLSALVDNALHFDGTPDGRRFKRVTWRRCLDLNDRALRHTVAGLGGTANGVPREDGFDITAASEVMATLCLANGLSDLKARLSRIIVGEGQDGKPITAGELKAVGPMTALLRDAMLPNLAQTTDGAPVLVHGGPFANIAHGCSSVTSTRAALALADVVCTEAGFGFDLGGEKFLHLKCRSAGLWPHAVVLVATVRAVRAHGGDVPGLEALEKGFANVARHLAAIRAFGLSPIVAINVFGSDTEEELALVEKLARAEGALVARNDGFSKGSEGSVALAEVVMQALERPAVAPLYLYDPGVSAQKKLEAIAHTVYGARSVELSPEAKKDLKKAEAWGLAGLPVCVAKTNLSFTDDATRQGAPTGFDLTVRRFRISAGAGFLLALTGEIMTMPGLAKAPAAWDIDLTDDGTITGLH